MLFNNFIKVIIYNFQTMLKYIKFDLFMKSFFVDGDATSVKYEDIAGK